MYIHLVVIYHSHCDLQQTADITICHWHRNWRTVLNSIRVCNLQFGSGQRVESINRANTPLKPHSSARSHLWYHRSFNLRILVNHSIRGQTGSSTYHLHSIESRIPQWSDSQLCYQGPCSVSVIDRIISHCISLQVSTLYGNRAPPLPILYSLVRVWVTDL